MKQITFAVILSLSFLGVTQTHAVEVVKVDPEQEPTESLTKVLILPSSSEPKPTKNEALTSTKYRCGVLFKRCKISDFFDRQNVCTSILLKGGKVEMYAQRHTKHCMANVENQSHGLRSVTKSITALMVGKIIHSNPNLDLDTTIDQALEPLGIDYPSQNRTVRDLLLMSSGMAWENVVDERRIRVTHNRPQGVPDTLVAAVDLFLDSAKFDLSEEKPAYSYSNFDSAILGLVAVAQSEHDTLAELFEATIWSNFETQFRAKWKADSFGNTRAWCCLKMAPVDAAAFGQWVLEQYKSPSSWVHDWLQQSTSDLVRSDIQCGFTNVRYGYQWWVMPNERDGFAAIGRRGQLIYIFPEQDAVVVQLSEFEDAGLNRNRCEAFRANRALADAVQ
jgi:CubicO group peptidase (beta-lactamase class C family)